VQGAGKMLKTPNDTSTSICTDCCNKNTTQQWSSVICSQPFYFFLGCAHKHLY